MPMLWLKRRSGPVSQAQKALAVCAAIIAVLPMMVCTSAQATAEGAVLNTSGPSTFHGEIAKGLKIEMRLYQDGPSLHGTYSYEAFGGDIQLKGTINEHGAFALQEFVNGKVTGNFEGKFVTMNRIEGRWFKKSSQDKGRSFYVVRTGGNIAATQASETPKPPKVDREPTPTTKEIRPVPKAETTGRAAPLAAEAHQQAVSSVKQPGAAVSREVPVAQPQTKTEPKVQPLEQASATLKPSTRDREASPAHKETRSVPKAEATGKSALMTAEAHQQAVSSVKQPGAAVSREVPVAQPQTKTEPKVQPLEQASATQQPPLKIEPVQQPSTGQAALSPKAEEEPSKVAPKTEMRPEEKPHVAGRAVTSTQKKGSSSWVDFFFNLKVGGAVGGILLLGGGLAWLAIVAGGAAAFRENSALFRQAHAMGVSFLPGIFLLALGVGAVLAVFVE